MAVLLEPMDPEELLTDLSLATGLAAFLVDRGALRLTGDRALARAREETACPGCAYPSAAACLVRWAVPDGRGVARCPAGRAFACLPLLGEGVSLGALVMGPLEEDAAEDARRVRALFTVMESVAARLAPPGLARRSDLFARIARHVAGHLTDDLTAGALHRALYASESAIAQAVKRETGLPLRRYVQARRLEAARTMLLTTSMTVMQVAERCGINDFNYFARIFKRRYGMSPSALRGRVGSAP